MGRGKTMTDIYDKIKGHAVTQSDVEPKDVREKLRYLIIDHIGGCDLRLVQRAHDITDALADSILSAFPALAQSDAERREAELREDERLGAALRRAQDAEDRLAALAQSDAEPVAWQRVKQVLEAARLCLKSRDQSPHEARVREAIEIILYTTAPPRPDASAGLIEAAEFTNQMFSLSFDITPIESCEIMELGEKLGLLEQVAYDPKIHDGEIDADEGELIYVRSAKGEALRARAADRSGPADYIPIGGAGNGA
jgi:hypothetical protein